MALTQQEKQQVSDLKKQGLSNTKIMGVIASQRRGEKPSTSLSPSALTSDPNSASADLRAGFQGAQTAFGEAQDRTATAMERPGLLGRVSGTLGAGFRFAGEALGSIGEGAVRALPGGTTAMDATEKAVGAGARAVANSPIGDVARTGYDALPQNARQAVGDVGNILGGATGIGTSVVAPGVTSAVTRKAIAPVQKAMQNIEPPKFKIDTPRAGELINKYRAQLSDINPQYETVLKQQPDATKTMAYFDQAEKAASDPSVPMATKLASDRAVTAYESIDKGLSEAGRLKGELLDSIANQKVPGNIAGEAIDDVKRTISERFGITINNKGEIAEASGRIASVDAKSQKLIREYVSLLRKLGQSPSARQLDDFVDATQRMLYKQSSPNLFEIADEPVVAFLKQETGKINSQLKQRVDQLVKGNGEYSYSELNEQYGKLIDMSESLNKRLGTEGDKGASLMKSLFSPQTGEPTRRLFQQIKEETGIDLFEEATLAKFAMEAVGDTRSKNLLQQIDALAGDASKVNLMEPGSWLNFIREKADLDGRDLANEIIKQSTSSTR